MFKFLKNKLKETVDKFAKKAEEESEELSVKELTQEDISNLEEKEKKEIENTVKPQEEIVFKPSKTVNTLVHSVDDLISEVNNRSVDKINEEKLGESLSKENSKKACEKPEFSNKSELDKEETNSDEIDPLIKEVIEKNKSFEDAKQQTVKPSTIDESNNFVNEEINEQKTEDIVDPKVGLLNDIDEEITKEEIVDDYVKDSDVVEDFISVDTEDVLDIANEKEETKGFFKKIFSKKESKDALFDNSSLIKDADLKVEVEKKSSDNFANEIVNNLDDVVKEMGKEKKEIETVSGSKESVVSSVSSSQSKEAVHKNLLKENIADSTKHKKGLFGKIKERVVKFQLTDDVFEELFWDFELALLEGNVASEVIEKIKSDLREKLTSETVSRKDVSEVIFETLKNSLDEILSVPTFDLIEKIKSHRSVGSTKVPGRSPFVICMVGVNGSGKTTTLAKLIYLFQKENLSMVVAAADTFRAAAIQQLEEHTNKLGVKLIKHDYNADPAAVAFDAIKHAQAKNLDLVLIDTAGRLQSNSNLMGELKKLVRVNKPDLTVFIGESITGNDCVEQAVAFNESVSIDGIVLSKADVDEKGGVAISVSYVTKKPILFLGTGQTYADLKPFNKKEILGTLGF